MIWAIIFLILSIVGFGLLLWCAGPDDSWMIVVGGLCMIAIGASFTILHNTIAPMPSAIDVYRGKTTLEITYRDSVAIDSTVVYKVK
jgi:hypothetical protein